MEKGPFDYDFWVYLWVLGVSSIGGVVNFVRNLRAGKTRPFNFIEFIGEIVTSGFVGLLTFWLCEWAKFPPLLAAPLIGITGHMGSRAMFMLEQIAERKFGKFGE